MPRALSVIAASRRQGEAVRDTAILSYAERSPQKTAIRTVTGLAIDIDLHDPVRLSTDDLLVLDDGSCVEVVAAPESLIEARAADIAALSRLAWHLGDRHIPAQIFTNRIRARRDEETETLLKDLGAKLLAIEAPFEPEGGAYAASHAHHDGNHAHDHDHAHDRHHGHHHPLR